MSVVHSAPCTLPPASPPAIARRPRPSNIPGCWRWLAGWIAALFFFALPPRVLLAAEVTVPLTIRLDLLTQQLVQHVYTSPGARAQLLDEGGCQTLLLDQPGFSRQSTHLRFTTHAAARLGTEVLGNCLNPIQWQGHIEVLLAPTITADWQLHLRILETNLYDEQWREGLLSGLLLELIQRLFLPRLTTLNIDLTPPRDDVRELLRTAIPPAEAERMGAMLRSISARAIELHDDALIVPLVLSVPDEFVQLRPLPAQPEAPLTEAELAAVQQALERWDAFLVFVVKGVGSDVMDAAIREKLLDLLLSSRYALLPALTGETPRGEGDPVRRLFIETWKQLHEIIEGAEARGLLKDKLLRYAGFVTAGDALLALDQAAPGLGIEISADGLRRLVRMLQPELREDPLRYDQEVDPALRGLFDFSPEPPAEPSELPAGPPADPPPPPRSLLEWPTPAYAAASEKVELAALMQRLNRWVPEESEFTIYSPVLEQLLRVITDQVLRDTQLEARYVPLYRNLVPATALQESCWQQFTRDDNQVIPQISSQGSIGLMQINRYVWRGFYNVERLKWDTAYNARAGAEILLRYLQQYGLAEAKQTGNLDNSARGVYAAYNAGPLAVSRYRRAKGSAREKQIDARFWKFYRGFAAGGEVDLSRCTVALEAGD